MGAALRPETAFVDTFGVPEYFTTHVRLENAGNGLIRSIRCVERNGVLFPVFSYVTPATCMLQHSASHREFAQSVLLDEVRALGSH